MISNKLLNPQVIEALKRFIARRPFSLNPILEKLLNELIKVEREKVIGDSRYECSEERKGRCNGFKNKTLITRFGKLELNIPQTR